MPVSQQICIAGSTHHTTAISIITPHSIHCSSIKCGMNMVIPSLCLVVTQQKSVFPVTSCFQQSLIFISELCYDGIIGQTQVTWTISAQYLISWTYLTQLIWSTCNRHILIREVTLVFLYMIESSMGEDWSYSFKAHICVDEHGSYVAALVGCKLGSEWGWASQSNLIWFKILCLFS